MQPDRVGRYRRVALVHDGLAIDEREGPERRQSLVKPVVRELRRQRLAEFVPPLGEQEQRDRLGREQRRADDQRLGGRMQLRGPVDGEGEGFRDRQMVLIFARRVLFRIQQFRRRRLQPACVFGERHLEPLAIGRRLFVRQRQAAERQRQRLRLSALLVASGAGDEIVRADSAGPDADFDRGGDSAPGVGVRGNEHAGRAAGRQIGLEAHRVDRVVVNEQNPLAFVAQPLAHVGQRRLLLLVGGDRAEAHAERNEIGAHMVDSVCARIHQVAR
jgi:hypothetical protein